MAGDRLGDAVERKHLVRIARLTDGTRHPPDDGGVLVLHQYGPSSGADLPSAVATVGSHAGEDDRQDRPVEGGHRRTEERVDRGAAVVLGRSLVEPGGEARPATARAAGPDDEVVVARREMDGARRQRPPDKVVD